MFKEVVLVDDTISDRFRWREFRCRAANELLINPTTHHFAEKMLTEFAHWYNRPVIINSGYRTPTHNKLVGGSPQSQHLQGLAADIPFPKHEYMDDTRTQEFLNNVKTKWFEICDKHGINGGVFYYSWGFHLDARTNRPRAHYDFRGR